MNKELQALLYMLRWGNVKYKICPAKDGSAQIICPEGTVIQLRVIDAKELHSV